MSQPIALVISEDSKLSLELVKALEKQNIQTSRANSSLEGIKKLKQNNFDFIFCDFDISSLSGLDILQIAKELHKESLFILVTFSTEKGLQALRLGAFHYLLKPLAQEAFATCVREGQKHMPGKPRQGKESSQELPIIAKSPQMQKLLKDAALIAKSQANVFISGESGTGKEVLAHAIHYLSSRSANSFIKVNCSAIPDTLLESEFFGHEKGAFTGADRKKLGRFEIADKGTLLLDEITEVPLLIQPKLLRAIQEKEFERVGGTRPVKVNVRLISTSNRDMQKAVAEKSFREDLFFRLHVIPLHIPPLRERKEDIIPLANHFLDKQCEENHTPRKYLSKEAEELLLSYPFPGNVRELGNIMERTIVMHLGKEIGRADLQLEIPSSQGVSIRHEGATLAEVEKVHILQTLKELGNNKTQTAKSLGISLRTLHNKLKIYEHSN